MFEKLALKREKKRIIRESRRKLDNLIVRREAMKRSIKKYSLEENEFCKNKISKIDKKLKACEESILHWSEQERIAKEALKKK